MPPDVPLETFFFEKISVGDAFEKYPISVPHVSAVAEEIAPKKNMDEQGEPQKIYSMAQIVGNPPLANI